MSSIFGALTSAASSLEAQRRGLDVAGQNIANVNTDGYTRRVLNLAEVPGASASDPGRGVTVAGVQAVRDLFLEARIRQEQTGVSRDSTVADSLSVLEAQLGQAGESVDAQMTSMFDAFSALTEDPASNTLRDAAVQESDHLAQSFRDMAARFESTRRSADTGVRDAVTQINALVGDIASTNQRIASATGADTESLIDTRTSLLKQLSSLVDITVTETSGITTVALTGGQTLVSGSYVVGLQIQDEPVTGLARVTSSGQDITASITSGSLGGQLYVRDTLMPGYTNALDQLAYGVATAVNTVHESGTDANGNPGVALFDVGSSAAGAAANIKISDAVAADSKLIVAAGATSNDVARQISQLRDATIVNGSTPIDSWGELVYRVGSDSQSAQRVESGRQQVLAQLQQLRDATSGVSLDEEAASLMRYQRAYEANARYFSMVNDLLDVLMQAVS